MLDITLGHYSKVVFTLEVRVMLHLIDELFLENLSVILYDNSKGVWIYLLL